ncbi:hypothetical protein MMMDOFMJ_1261 [Methylobacterium gnaphalii]|uniref:Uncharacterized protein n=2 Tax=Methylobacterium gnaphalii TaxID=1010610 RepID=A0A512JIU5_9HYPH|nr:hypothetical protein MGN01_17300 [Methylobacterium gnaphalii]GJD68338.1 hypothetical protein MMMDOFMJ_1261 [Methylobacterium gnaphalii]GLS49914.1 hypothetical protein GCM10007885_27660 [Methylobacterium gnaphalii]
MEPGRTAYEARFAGEKQGPRGTVDEWEMLCPSAKAIWQRMEDEVAKMIFAEIQRFYDAEIGMLMHQAEFWHENGAPAAVHHRVMNADSYFQIVSLMHDLAEAKEPLKLLSRRITTIPAGTYPPLAHIHAYRDVTFAAKELAAANARKRGQGNA